MRVFSSSRLWFSLICGVFLLAAACSPPLTTEQEVTAAIRDMEASFEAGERRPFMEHVAATFSGQNGTMNHDQLNAFMLLQLRRYQSLSAQLFPIQVVELGDGYAEARFNALVVGGPGLLPDNGQLYELDTSWEKQGDTWLLTQARWTPIFGERRRVLD